MTRIDVFLDGDTLYTDGQDDTSGESFPPYKVPIHYCEDGKFRWRAWPSLLELHRGDDLGKVTMYTPGGNVYHGERIGEPRRT